MELNKEIRNDSLIIALLGCILFIPFIGTVPLFDWDEINFAEAAREMMVSGDYTHVQINFTTFWEKPPLFFWMQVLSMKVFGVNEFAARLPNALTGSLTLVSLYLIGRHLSTRTFAFLWVLVYAGSILPHFYFRTGIIDPIFNLFIFLSIYGAFRVEQSENSSGRMKWVVFSGIASGMSILTKGPVGLLDFLLTVGVMMMVRKKFWLFQFKEWAVFFVATGLVSFIWFAYELIQNGPFFLQEFIVYQIRLFKTQDAGHGGPFFYHWVVILLGCFPLSYFALQGWKKKIYATTREQAFLVWSIVSFFVVLILFSIVKTKIAHYSSFCYLPLSYIATGTVYSLWKGESSMSTWLKWSIILTGSIVGIVLIAFPILMTQWEKFYPILLPYIKDPFAAANFSAPVQWSGWEALSGVGYLSVFIGAIYFLNKNIHYSLTLFFVSSIVFHETVLPAILPNIERYVQGEVIDFYKSKQNEDAYVEVVNFKSYAHLYYTQKPNRRMDTYDKFVKTFPEDTYAPSFEDWLRYYPTDKPVYLVTKIGREAELEADSNFVRIGGQHGYCFYRKK
jgi:hypothetical protein